MANAMSNLPNPAVIGYNPNLILVGLEFILILFIKNVMCSLVYLPSATKS